MLNVLFVCTLNHCRSATAEVIFKGMNGVWARSAGIDPKATVPVTDGLIAWADLIICFEQLHVEVLKRSFVVAPHEIHNVNIDDGHYGFMDPMLIDHLRASCWRLIRAAETQKRLPNS